MATTLASVARSQLSTDRKKFGLTSVGIALAAFFLTAVFLLGASLNATIRASMGEVYGKADTVLTVDGSDESIQTPYLPTALVESLLQVQNLEVQPLTIGSLGPAYVGQQTVYFNRQLFVSADLFPFEIEGQMPVAENEAVMSADLAQTQGLGIGSTYEVDSTDSIYSGSSQKITMTITGLFTPVNSSIAYADAVFEKSQDTADLLLSTGPGESSEDSTSIFTTLLLAHDGSASGETPVDFQLPAEVQKVMSASSGQKLRLETPQQAVDRQVEKLSQGTIGIVGALLIFAALALFVSSFVIANTFTVLTTQRTRELALLRTLGASQPQLLGMLLAQALLLGFFSSLAGVALAYAVALVVQLVKSEILVSFSPWAGLAGLLVATLVTVFASLRPCLRTFAISPLAAMRAAEDKPESKVFSLPAFLLALVLLTIGAISTLLGWLQADYAFMLVACLSLCLSALLLFPLMLVPCSRVLAQLLGRSSAQGQVIAGRVMNSPHRSISIGRSIFVSVSLVTAVLVGYTSVRASILNHLDEEFPVDLVVQVSQGAVGQLPSTLEAVRGVDGVQAATGVLPAGTLADIGAPVYAGSASDLERVIPSLSEKPLADHEIFISATTLSGVRDGDTVQVQSDLGEVELTLRTHKGSFHLPLITEATAARLSKQLPSSALPAELEPGAGILIRTTGNLSVTEANRVHQQITQATETADVYGALSQRIYYEDLLYRVLLVILGLLSMTVLISLVGITNTVALTGHQRRRENALMRTLGLSAARLREVISREALIIGAVSTGLGIIFGMVLGTIALHLLFTSSLTIIMSIPWLALATTALVTLALVWLSVYLPARNAAKIPPVAALAES